MAKQTGQRARQNRRKRRAAQQPQASTGNDPTMDLDISDQKDDERRRNTSSEDEGDEDDEDNHGQLTTTGPPIDPNVADLVDHASQMIGHSGADGAAMAIAATNRPNPSEALALLAASSAVANMGVESVRSLAASATAGSDLANEGLRNSDVTYDNRFRRYDQELQRLQNRVALLEGLLSRVLSMMQNGNIDAAEVAQMLRNLGI